QGFVRERMADAPSMLDPIKDIGVRNDALEDALEKLRDFERELARNPLEEMMKGSTSERDQFEAFTEEHTKVRIVENEVKQLKQELRRKKMDLRTGTELLKGEEILLKLGYIDGNDVLRKKRKIAVCIPTADDLLLTELLVSGEMEKIASDAEIGALLLCFVCDEPSASRVVKD
ncbi:hypothetical protein PMAYCL1PPCAC_05355, partial [Pristionchus mayeri]